MEYNELRVKFFGGFHKPQETIVKIKLPIYIDTSGDFNPWYELTEPQERRIRNKFCGLSGCTCGGSFNVKWEILK